MSLQAVQALISKAFADKDFKRRLLAKPDEVFSEFNLSHEEKEAVRRVQGRMGLATDIGQIEEEGPLGWIG